MRESEKWCSKKDPELAVAMLDEIIDTRRCERREVECYETFNDQQMTARTFVELNGHIFFDENVMASLRRFMEMSMLLKLASNKNRKRINKHDLWEVCTIYMQYTYNIQSIYIQ